MGYLLWIDEETAWAAGTYEYRAIGAAVIACRDLFRRADFSPRRRPPSRSAPSYVGHFASIGEINHLLRERRRTSRTRSGFQPDRTPKSP